MNKEYFYRQLYWFLTREPQVKVAIIVSIGVALLFGCAVLYAAVSVAFSPPSSSSRDQGSSDRQTRSVQLPPTFTPVSMAPGSGQEQQQLVGIDSEAGANTHSSIDNLAWIVVGGDERGRILRGPSGKDGHSASLWDDAVSAGNCELGGWRR